MARMASNTISSLSGAHSAFGSATSMRGTSSSSGVSSEVYRRTESHFSMTRLMRSGGMLICLDADS